MEGRRNGGKEMEGGMEGRRDGGRNGGRWKEGEIGLAVICNGTIEHYMYLHVHVHIPTCTIVHVHVGILGITCLQ